MKHKKGNDLNSFYGQRCVFTLVECEPSKGRISLLAVSANPANFPVQAGSLASAFSKATCGKSGATKSQDGNPVRFANIGLVISRHSPDIFIGEPVGQRKIRAGINGRLLASQSGKTNTQAVG